MAGGDLGTIEPRLESFPDPDRLRRLTVSECTELAGRIRAFLIENVSRTGGHLGANLSSVELTIALHRAFRSPETAIVWDTGHQCYTHKILTGRHGGFADLRARGGMSGFPSRAESQHDLLENSHASVGPAWAHGVATATGRTVVTVVGDGALTGGVAFEALNAIGYRRTPVVVVLNDNGRSYSDTPSRLTYGEPLVRQAAPGADPEAFFRALGFAYDGPVDGHDVEALDEAFARAARGPLPRVVHVRTQKGHGWPRALTDVAKRLHDVGPGHPAPRIADEVPSWSAVVGELLRSAAAADARVCAITAAMGDTVGLGPFRTRFPDRYHDLGIAEQACVAMAAGLASQGMRPFFAVVSTFLTRAMDQVLNDVALHRLPVVFLLDRAGVTGPDGPSHHGVFDVGLLRNVPGIEIYSPATVSDIRDLLTGLLGREHGPVVIRYPKGRPLNPANGRFSAEGLLRGGDDACMITHGDPVGATLAAAETLEARDGIRSAVWRLNRIDTLHKDLLTFAAGRRLLIPVEELSASGGVAGLLAGELARAGRFRGRITPLVLPAQFLPHGPREGLLDEFGFTPDKIAGFVRSAVRDSANDGPAGR
jgi:1-deoxy-D-xylulose-5-phosphate synthase